MLCWHKRAALKERERLKKNPPRVFPKWKHKSPVFKYQRFLETIKHLNTWAEPGYLPVFGPEKAPYWHPQAPYCGSAIELGINVISIHHRRNPTNWKWIREYHAECE